MKYDFIIVGCMGMMPVFGADLQLLNEKNTPPSSDAHFLLNIKELQQRANSDSDLFSGNTPFVPLNVDNDYGDVASPRSAVANRISMRCRYIAMSVSVSLVAGVVIYLLSRYA